jgi:hypothetical protein
VRHLISNLERESISLAHVWPRTYPANEDSAAASSKTTCYWFVGLVVGGAVGGQLDLTAPIKTFTDIVMRAAIQIHVWQPGMRIEAYYKRRKELAPYLPASERWKLRSERKSTAAASTSSSALGGSLNNSPAAAAKDAAGVKRRLPDTVAAGVEEPEETVLSGGGVVAADEDEFSSPPPLKRSHNSTTDIEMTDSQNSSNGGGGSSAGMEAAMAMS